MQVSVNLNRKCTLPRPNRGVVWTRDGDVCLPFFKYGQEVDGSAEYFEIPQHYWPVFRANWDETRTPKNERGILNEDATVLYY
jgi:hypothetical protein